MKEEVSGDIAHRQSTSGVHTLAAMIYTVFANALSLKQQPFLNRHHFIFRYSPTVQALDFWLSVRIFEVRSSMVVSPPLWGRHHGLD